MNEKLSAIIIVLLVVLFGVVIVQMTCPKSQCYTTPATTLSQKYPLFLDDHGRVVDPYVKREVKNTITANAGDIQKCYNTFIDQVKADNTAVKAGSVHIDWLVNPDGSVKSGRIIFTNFSDDNLSSCIINKLEAWKFPPPGETRYAEHRFQFSQK